MCCRIYLIILAMIMLSYQVIHLSVVWRTIRPPGKVRHGCVIYQENLDGGYRHCSFWSVRIWKMGASRSVILPGAIWKIGPSWSVTLPGCVKTFPNINADVRHTFSFENKSWTMLEYTFIFTDERGSAGQDEDTVPRVDIIQKNVFNFFLNWYFSIYFIPQNNVLPLLHTSDDCITWYHYVTSLPLFFCNKTANIFFYN